LNYLCDILVIKIARKGNRGRNSVENIMMGKITEDANGERFWASIPSTLDGDIESASTHPDYDLKLIDNNEDVNKFPDVKWRKTLRHCGRQ
jgi:hypothetical protein